MINRLARGKNNTGCRQICNSVFKHLFLMFQYPIKWGNSCFWFACRRYVRWDLAVCCLGCNGSPAHSRKQPLQARRGTPSSFLNTSLQTPKSPPSDFCSLGHYCRGVAAKCESWGKPIVFSRKGAPPLSGSR